MPARIKPVNDLYVDNRKLGGILVESLVRENTLQTVITGIGLNLRAVDRPLTGEQAHPGVVPVSLEECLIAPAWAVLSADATMDELVSELTVAVHARYTQLIRDGWPAIETLYNRFAVNHSVDAPPTAV